MCKSKSWLLILSFLCLSVCSCAGARSQIRFDTAEFPVSLTKVVPDRDGHILQPSEQEVMGLFKASKWGWDICWSIIPLRRADFSKEINEQVNAVNGEAVVNLEIEAGDNVYNAFTWITALHWIPACPGAVSIELKGDIIRSRRSLENKPSSEEVADSSNDEDAVNYVVKN